MNGRELPATNKKEMDMNIDDKSYPVEFDDKGHLVVKEGDNIIFDGHIYIKNSSNYLIGKLNGVDVKLKESYFN
ncbi:MAG: hypothetical protein KBT39_02090 [Bacteroidales bacterium]|nr:hypothetical protein [Bacteroidales bacterium]